MADLWTVRVLVPGDDHVLLVAPRDCQPSVVVCVRGPVCAEYDSERYFA